MVVDPGYCVTCCCLLDAYMLNTTFLQNFWCYRRFSPVFLKCFAWLCIVLVRKLRMKGMALQSQTIRICYGFEFSHGSNLYICPTFSTHASIIQFFELRLLTFSVMGVISSQSIANVEFAAKSSRWTVGMAMHAVSVTAYRVFLRFGVKSDLASVPRAIRKYRSTAIASIRNICDQ